MARTKTASLKVVTERSERLRYIQKYTGISRHELCHNTDLKYDTVYRWETGKSQTFNEQRAAALIDKLKQHGVMCTLEWLLHGKGHPPHRTRDIIGTPAGNRFELEKIQQELTLLSEHHLDIVHHQVIDNTMYPLFKQDDHVAGLKLESDDYHRAIGQICLVKPVDSLQILVRKIERSAEKQKHCLICLEPEQNKPLLQPDITLDLVAPLIWWRRPAFNIARST